MVDWIAFHSGNRLDNGEDRYERKRKIGGVEEEGGGGGIYVRVF